MKEKEKEDKEGASASDFGLMCHGYPFFTYVEVTFIYPASSNGR
jgi:hypothetical protein